ncbi:MAG: hypothetical protein ACRDU8_07450, partial [Egibacteraceae bacterium]
MTTATDTAPLEPRPIEEGPTTLRGTTPARWLRENLFSNWYNSLLTVVFGGLLGWVGYKALRYVFVSGRWEIVERNLTLYMLGRFPRNELDRSWTAIVIAVLLAGIMAGVAARRRGAASWRDSLRRAAPALLLLAVLLGLSRTLTP